MTDEIIDLVEAPMDQQPHLYHELKVYKWNLDYWLSAGYQGYWALIKKDVVYIYVTYSEAITSGYRLYGLGSFLVKKIEPVETIHFISRLL